MSQLSSPPITLAVLVLVYNKGKTVTIVGPTQLHPVIYWFSDWFYCFRLVSFPKRDVMVIKEVGGMVKVR
jgi:hypothetical protein